MDQILGLLAGQLLTNETVKTVSKKANTTKKETTDVVSEALPTLLTGLFSASKQSSSKSTGENILTSLLAQAVSTNVEEEDEEKEEEKNELGSSILDTILGNTKTDLFTNIAKKIGLKKEQVMAILIAVAPILLKKVASLVNTNTSDSSKKSTKKSTSAKKSTSTKKSSSKKKASEKEEDFDVTDILSSIVGNVLGNDSKKSDDDSNLLGEVASTVLSGLLSKNKK